MAIFTAALSDVGVEQRRDLWNDQTFLVCSNSQAIQCQSPLKAYHVALVWEIGLQLLIRQLKPSISIPSQIFGKLGKARREGNHCYVSLCCTGICLKQSGTRHICQKMYVVTCAL